MIADARAGKLKFPDVAILDIATAAALEQLTAHQISQFVDNCGRWPNPLPIGCACSGSEVFGMGVEALLNRVSDMAMLPLSVQTHVQLRVPEMEAGLFVGELRIDVFLLQQPV